MPRQKKFSWQEGLPEIKPPTRGASLRGVPGQLPRKQRKYVPHCAVVREPAVQSQWQTYDPDDQSQPPHHHSSPPSASARRPKTLVLSPRAPLAARDSPEQGDVPVASSLLPPIPEDDHGDDVEAGSDADGDDDSEVNEGMSHASHELRA